MFQAPSFTPSTMQVQMTLPLSLATQFGTPMCAPPHTSASASTFTLGSRAFTQSSTLSSIRRPSSVARPRLESHASHTNRMVKFLVVVLVMFFYIFVVTNLDAITRTFSRLFEPLKTQVTEKRLSVTPFPRVRYFTDGRHVVKQVVSESGTTTYTIVANITSPPSISAPVKESSDVAATADTTTDAATTQAAVEESARLATGAASSGDAPLTVDPTEQHDTVVRDDVAAADVADANASADTLADTLTAGAAGAAGAADEALIDSM